MERRSKRSTDRTVALQYLVEAVADRSHVSSVALVDEEGHIVAGIGSPTELSGLALIAGPATRGEPCREFEQVTLGTDFLGRRVKLGDQTLYLAALGKRVSKMHEAASAVCRIIEAEGAIS
jgi:hypothetical protein